MRREYRVTKITNFLSWGGEFVAIFGIVIAFFIRPNITHIWQKFTVIAAFCLMTYGMLMSLFFKLTFDKEKFTIRNIMSLFLLSFPKYLTCKWEDIKMIEISCGFLFEDGALVTIQPKHRIKGAFIIPVGLGGISFSAIKEILSHIPEGVEVHIDPVLKKYIDHPEKMYRYNLRLGIIALAVFTIWTIWLFTRPGMMDTIKQNLPKAMQQLKINK